MDDLEKLVQEKLKVVINLIRPSSSADDVLKITQGYRNLVDGENSRTLVGVNPKKKQGADAS